MPDGNDFTQTVDQWHATVIANAVYFTAVVFKGQGVYDRRECKTLAEAREAAKTMTTPNGRKPMIYAVDKFNHDVLVEVVRS